MSTAEQHRRADAFGIDRGHHGGFDIAAAGIVDDAGANGLGCGRHRIEIDIERPRGMPDVTLRAASTSEAAVTALTISSAFAMASDALFALWTAMVRAARRRAVGVEQDVVGRDVSARLDEIGGESLADLAKSDQRDAGECGHCLIQFSSGGASLYFKPRSASFARMLLTSRLNSPRR
jgi:hypothetical protein